MIQNRVDYDEEAAGSVHVTRLDAAATGPEPRVLSPREIALKLDGSWPHMSSLAEPPIQRAGAVVDSILKRADYTAGPAPSAIPAILVVSCVFYALHVTVALFIARWSVFVAWEESFALCVQLFAWVASSDRARAYVAREYSQKVGTKHHGLRLTYLIVAYAQSKPAVALEFLVPWLRLFIRIAAFFAHPVLVIETACECTALLLGLAYGIRHVTFADEKSATEFVTK